MTRADAEPQHHSQFSAAWWRRDGSLARPHWPAPPPGIPPPRHGLRRTGPAVTGPFRALLAPGPRRTTLLFWSATIAGLVIVYGASTWLPTLMVDSGYDLSSSLEYSIAFDVGARLRGTALGFSLGVGRIGAIVGPSYLAAVAVLVAAPQAGFYAFVIPAVLGAVLIGLLKPGTRRAQAAPSDALDSEAPLAP
ncbi:hypothetical protein OH717_12260 [Streptomyces albidoflavus]|nr:hypothetical protein OH717_12260 [Streptomyces albidoflavus]